MIPLVPTIALAFFSFLCSAFVILRIVYSILPRRSLGRRVYPLTLSRTSSHSLPAADKGYVWLALCDISAVAVFSWEALCQWFHPRSSSETSIGTASSRVNSAARLWLALTLHQTCFLVISALILIHVHLRKSVSFGFAHWFLWTPLVVLATVTTTIAADIFADHADTSRKTFLIGYVVYASAIAVLNTIIFGSLVRSLVVVRRSLANFHSANKSSVESTEKHPQVILAPEDIEDIREGSSWITSPPSSHNNKSSARHPYSTTPTGTAASPQSTTISLRFPFWHSLGTRGTYPSTLPRTPSPCQGDTFAKEFGLLRPRTQSLRAAAATALTLSTLGSWLPSSLGTGTHPTVSARSYPTQHSGPRDRVRTVGGSAIAASTPTQDRSLGSDARPVITAPASVKVSASDQNQYAPSSPQAEKGTAAVDSPQIEISTLRILAWLAGVWVPLVLSLPYVIFSLNGSDLDSRRNDEFASTFLAISVTISSPILVLNLLLRHPIPIPCDIFGAAPPDPRPMSMLRGAPSVAGSGPTLADSYRQGSGTTGQGTPDARLIKDGAVDGGKGYRTRFPRVLAPAPRLSVFPLGDEKRLAAAFSPAQNWHYVQGAFPTQLPSPPAPARAASRGHSFRHHG